MKTDEQGRYRLDGLIAGMEYRLSYKRPDTGSWRYAEESFTAEGGDMPHVVDIYLEQ